MGAMGGVARRAAVVALWAGPLLLSQAAMAEDDVIMLQPVTVTGSRLNLTPGQETQELQVYSAEDIAKSGQPSVSEFLNTLPVVSAVDDPEGLQTDNGVTGVRLHGLPFDATLVLIDGKRVGTSAAGAFNNIFDLNNIPIAAIERIEILPQGGSAIYGSDAIGGVINIILKKDFEGVTASGKYGGADHTEEGDLSATWGTRSNHGSASVIASYQVRTQLLGQFRALT